MNEWLIITAYLVIGWIYGFNLIARKVLDWEKPEELLFIFGGILLWPLYILSELSLLSGYWMNRKKDKRNRNQR